MNIGSLQPLRNKYIHIAYISIIASLLLWGTLGPTLLQAAAQEADEAQLETLCTHYGEGVVINRGGRTETIFFGEWLAMEHPELVDFYNEVGCPDDIGEVTWSHQTIIQLFRSLPNVPQAVLFDHFITFTGDVSGNCLGDLTLLRQDSETAEIDWIIACEATVEGRSGTLVLLVTGIYVPGNCECPDESLRRTGQFTWEIIGSRGDLANMSGEGTADIHSTGERLDPGPQCTRPEGQTCAVFEGTFRGELRAR